MISKFNQYINEGIRDKMTPKSEDDIRKSLEKLPPLERITKIYHNNVQDLYTRDEINEILEHINPVGILEIAIYYLQDLELVKKLIKEGVDLSVDNNAFLKAIIMDDHYDNNIVDILDGDLTKEYKHLTESWFTCHCLDESEEDQEKIMNFYKEVLKLFLTDPRVYKKLTAIEIVGYRTLLGINQ